MAHFDKAHVVKSTGEILLLGGQTYFIDNDEEDILSVLPKLSELLDGSSFLESVQASRGGQMMVSIRPSKDVIIPNAVAKQTGFFYVLPKGTTLRKAQKELYGETPTASSGVFDWLASEYPQVLEAMKKGAETYKETGEAIGKIGIDMSKVLLGVGGGILLIMVLSRVGQQRESL